MINGFSDIAEGYTRRALIQRKAAEALLDILSIKPHEDVLDVGCGPGNATARIRKLTRGRVVGVDPSEDMIREARKRVPEGVEFICKSAEEMSFHEEFDVVFSNSALQWFYSPQKALKNCFNALRSGGRIGVQAPAKQVYSPNFIDAIERVKSDPEAGRIFSHFRVSLSVDKYL